MATAKIDACPLISVSKINGDPNADSQTICFHGPRIKGNALDQLQTVNASKQSDVAKKTENPKEKKKNASGRSSAAVKEEYSAGRNLPPANPGRNPGLF